MNFLLLDADVIIDLHRLGLWKQIVKNHKVYIPSIVLHREVYFYEDNEGNRISINLKSQIGKSLIEISADASELVEFNKVFDSVFQCEIHDGEKEALLLLKQNEDMIMCSCDGSAIKALGLLDLNEQGISFEKLLEKTGMRKNLSYKYSERRFKKLLGEGVIMRIQGSGLNKS